MFLPFCEDKENGTDFLDISVHSENQAQNWEQTINVNERFHGWRTKIICCARSLD